MLDSGFLHIPDVARGNTTAGFDQYFTLGVFQLEIEQLATQAGWHQFNFYLVTLDVEGIGVEEHGKNLFGRKTERTQ